MAIQNAFSDFPNGMTPVGGSQPVASRNAMLSSKRYFGLPCFSGRRWLITSGWQIHAFSQFSTCPAVQL